MSVLRILHTRRHTLCSYVLLNSTACLKPTSLFYVSQLPPPPPSRKKGLNLIADPAKSIADLSNNPSSSAPAKMFWQWTWKKLGFHESLSKFAREMLSSPGNTSFTWVTWMYVCWTHQEWRKWGGRTCIAIESMDRDRTFARLKVIQYLASLVGFMTTYSKCMETWDDKSHFSLLPLHKCFMSDIFEGEQQQSGFPAGGRAKQWLQNSC